MKKILTFLMVFVALFTFVACDTGNSSSGNGGNGTSNVETINPDNVAKEFADCTTDVDVENMEISDGSWTVIEIQQSTGGILSLKLQATVEDDYFTYTSGTATSIVDASIMLEEEPELLDALRNAKNDEEKTAIMIELQGEMPEGATLTWDGLIGTMTYPLNQEDLEDYSEDIQFSSLPEFAVVKCNADKTKYVISITYERDESEITETYYIEKN
ncbi:MAG: hypothetical protein J6A14_01870 [Spirochaetaceae bacterium]|nr:hypothetical protein [Spirochaetaceae bacterium]